MTDFEPYKTDKPRLNGGVVFGFLTVLGATVLAFAAISQISSPSADSARITYLDQERPWQRPAANGVSEGPSERSPSPEEG